MAGNYTGNKITQNALSRAVQSVGRTTASSIRQIEDFQSEWQESINREKEKSKNGQHTQTKHKADHSTPIPTFLPRKVSYQAVNTNIRPISKPSRVTPPRNQNINSHSSTTKKNSCIKTTILTRVLIQPRPLSGKTQLRFNAKFDTSRAKALLSENFHDHFGSMDVVTYPGPVGIEDANGDQVNSWGR